MGFTTYVPGNVVWKKRFPEASDQAIDLLTKLLSFNPKKRISVYQAIQHEYFAQIIALETPPTSKVKFSWDWEYDNAKLLNSIPVIKKLIYMESLRFHPEEDQRQSQPSPSPQAIIQTPTKPTQVLEESKDAVRNF